MGADLCQLVVGFVLFGDLGELRNITRLPFVVSVSWSSPGMGFGCPAPFSWFPVCKATELFFCCCVDSSGAFPCQSAFDISCGGSSRVNQALVVFPAFSQDFFHC